MKTVGDETIYREPLDDIQFNVRSYGLTKREYFAAVILSGMKASTPGSVGESCAYFAVKEADALIKALNGEVSNEIYPDKFDKK